MMDKNIHRCLLILCLAVGIPLLLAAKPKIVCSASMFADMTRVMAADFADLDVIVPIGGDPHLHDPTPRDARIVAAADLILVNGLSFEGWINELIENSGTKAKIVTITSGIEPIRSELFKGSTDPHAWMAASNGRIYIRNIRDALIGLLPEHVEEINRRYEQYDLELTKLDQYIQEKIGQIPDKNRILITSHDAFAYYGRRYGIGLEPIMGISTEAEAQTSDILRVTRVIRENKIPVVFIESTINPKLLEQIARDQNIGIGGQLYADSLGDISSPASTYLDMLKYNTDIIYAGLTGAGEYSSLEKNSEKSWFIYLGIGILLIGSFIYMFARS